MTIDGPGVLVLLALGAAFGCWATVRWQRWRGCGTPARPRDVRRPDPGGKGWERTALYRWRGDGGTGPRGLLYVGISSDPQARTNQHAADPQKAAMLARAQGAPDVQWWPDRYQALAAESALIDELSPPFNRRPSGTCDAWTQSRPPVTRGRVRLPAGAGVRAKTQRWVRTGSWAVAATRR